MYYLSPHLFFCWQVPYFGFSINREKNMTTQQKEKFKVGDLVKNRKKMIGIITEKTDDFDRNCYAVYWVVGNEAYAYLNSKNGTRWVLEWDLKNVS